MSKDYQAIATEIFQAVGQLKKSAPETIDSFHQLVQQATKPGQLDAKTKELIALALGVAARCEGCLVAHTKKLIGLGVSRDEIIDMLGVCIAMGGGPSYMYAAETLKIFDALSNTARS